MSEHKLRVKVTDKRCTKEDIDTLKSGLEMFLRKSGFEVSGEIEIWRN